MIAERQLKLALFISQHGPVTRANIYDALPCYQSSTASEASIRRKFERDKQELESLGFVFKLDGLDRYSLDVKASTACEMAMTSDQASTLRWALTLLLADEAYPLKAEARMALIKLSSELQVPDMLPSIAFGTSSDTINQGTLNKVRSALAGCKRLAFDYENAQGELSRRTTEPKGCFVEGGMCYLAAFDLDRQAMRIFNVGRMSRLHVNAAASATPDFEIEPFNAADWCKPAFLQGSLQGTAQVCEADGGIQTVAFASAQKLAERCIETGAHPLSPTSVTAAYEKLLQNAAHSLANEGMDAQAVAKMASKPKRHGKNELGKQDLPLALLVLLEQQGMVSIPQAACLMGCSEDSIYTALEQLVFCYDEAGAARLELGEKGCAFARLSRHSGRSLRLTIPELSVIYDALVACGFEPNCELMQAIAAQKGVPGASSSLAALDHVHALTRYSDAEIFQAVASACDSEGNGSIRIKYQSAANSTPQQRTVQPLGMITRNGHRYLQAWCFTACALRDFRLDRISSVASCPGEQQAHSCTAACGNNLQPLTAVVAMEASTWSPRWQGMGTPKRLADGTRAYALPWYGTQWLPQHLAAQGGKVWPLYPQSLVEATKACCK